MSEMQERVAAMLKLAGLNEDWDVRMAYATAVMVAMRDPTEAMVLAADLLTTQRHGRAAIYTTMIDAALTLKPAPSDPAP